MAAKLLLSVSSYVLSPFFGEFFLLDFLHSASTLKVVFGPFTIPRFLKARLVMSQQNNPRRRRLEVENIGDVTVVNFIDRKILDEQNIQIIGEQLFSLVDDEGWRKILLNFGNIEYWSAAAFGKLITLNKKLQGVGGSLVLCNIAPQVLEVLEMTKLDKFFNIQKEEQAALQAF